VWALDPAGIERPGNGLRLSADRRRHVGHRRRVAEAGQVHCEDVELALQHPQHRRPLPPAAADPVK